MNILIIGATIIDIVSTTYNPITKNRKNIGKTTYSYSGTGRNIAENLARLNMKIDFLTSIGNDVLGNHAIEYLRALNINVLNYDSNHPTNSNLKIKNNLKHEFVSITSIAQSQDFNVDSIKDDYDFIAIDLNNPKILHNICKLDVPIFVDATCTSKVSVIKKYLRSIKYLKCTREEYKKIFNIPLTKAIKSFPNLNIIITDKENPICYNQDNNIYITPPNTVDIVNTNGIEDAYSAGLVYGLTKNYSIHKSIEFAKKLAESTARSNLPINQKVSEKIFMNYKTLIEIKPEVKEAMNKNIPIVALESSVISHGIPYPKNLKVALHCEKIIRMHGCIPATIFVDNGKIKIGATRDELEKLASNKDIIKTSVKDLSYALVHKMTGTATLATTMIAANLAGIKVVSAGGIGGVHRGVDKTFDISADLEVISSTPICVVTAGIKSILDLPKTLEYLETRGVEVLGYKTKLLPEFYTIGKEFKVNHQVDSPNEIAKIIRIKHSLNLNSGILVTNPIPKEYAMKYEDINKHIDTAISDMKDQNIKGPQATPFLLKSIANATRGNSINCHTALLFNNVSLSALIAKHL